MGLLDTIFPRRTNGRLSNYFKTITSYQPTYTTFAGGVYEAQQSRAAINAFATHCSKLKPEVVGSANKQLAAILNCRPNPWQTTSQFLARCATILSVNNTLFIAPLWDDMHETVKGYYPLLPENCTVVDVGGIPWLRYRMKTGEAALPLSECAVITDNQYHDDFFGDDNRAMLPTLQMIHAQNEGIVNGVKNGGAVRFLAKLGSVLKQEAIDDERKRFVASNLSTEAGGVMIFDSKYDDVRQVSSTPFIVDAEQMKIINESVENYFHVPRCIIANDYTEQQYNAFYEGKVEPFAVQLGQALTAITFTEHERAFNNEIMFSANRLQYASISSKLSVSQQLLDRGVLSRNEVREIWQLPHIDGGDDYVIRGEYKSDNDVKDTGGENDGT